MKKILMILQTDFPPDIRLEKEIRSLASVGYVVKVVCNQYERGLNPEFQFCSIDRVNATFKSTRLNKILNFPIFFNPRFLFRTLFSTIKFKPNFIHAHDLPMAPLGLLFGKIFKLPVVLDMHENYPAALKAFQKKGIFNFIFKNYHAAKVLEKYCVKKADRMITVIEENSERLIKLGVLPTKIFVVSNTVDVDTFAQGKIDEKIINKYKGKFILLYSGFISPERGLDTVVKGMKFLKDKLTNVKLLLVGNGISIPFLKNIVKENEIEDFIDFIAWPGHENLGSYLEIADVGISPQPNNEHWNNSIPHKLFEYMSQSIPVLVTDAIPLKRIIIETNAGLSYMTADPEDFAIKILEIASSNINFGENGKKAVKEKYNWERDAQVLIKMYNVLSG
jgi:glycosyltransferase involved in cell wall biosynthesis